jgi:hypothetical protein
MKENETITPEKDMQEIAIEDINNNLKDIVAVNVAVWRKNIEGRMVVVPVKKLEQYLKEEDTNKFKFFIEINWRERIKEFSEAAKKTEAPEAPAVDETAVMKEVEKFGRVEEQVELFKKMTVVEREEILDDCIGKLSESGESKKLDIAQIVNMVGVISNTFYANNADIEENVSTSDQKQNIYGVLVKSDWIIKILIGIFSQEGYPYSDLKLIDKISSGSWTIDHINKVFIRFISFCIFFNEYISKGIFTKNIRGAFKEKYHRYYKKRLPDTDITIEKIFKNGIRRIDKEKEMQAYVLGSLLFDIGKIRDIKYHDGADPYNDEMVKRHSLYGFNMIAKAKQYPFEVMAMSVFHHEYYGGKGSYNFTKPLLTKFSGKKAGEENIKYFISYDKDDFINGVSLSFFPCKLMEIIDIFDALTGKKNMPAGEALKTMKKEFIIKSLKIDPIIYKIFLEYCVNCGILQEKEMTEIDAIIF